MNRLSRFMKPFCFVVNEEDHLLGGMQFRANDLRAGLDEGGGVQEVVEVAPIGTRQPVLVVNEEDHLLGERPQLGGGALRVRVSVLLCEGHQGRPSPPTWVAETQSSWIACPPLDVGRGAV